MVSLRFSGLVLLILMALYVLLGRVAMGLAGSFQEDIAAMTGEALKVKVNVVSLQGGWKWFDPTLEVRGLQFELEGQSLVAIDTASLKLSLIHSLIEGVPVVTRLAGTGVRLGVEETTGGQWKLAGFKAGKTSLSLDDLLASVPHLEALLFDEVEVMIYSQSGDYMAKSFPDEPMKLRRELLHQEFSMPFEITAQGSRSSGRIELMGTYSGDPRRENFETELYVNLPRVDLLDFLPVSPDRFVSMDTEAELWINHNDDESSLVGRVRSTGLEVLSSNGARVKPIENVNLEFAGVGQDESYQLQISSLRVATGRDELVVEDLRVALDRSEPVSEVVARLPRLDVTRVLSFAKAVDAEHQLLGEDAAESLRNVDIGGNLQDVMLSASFDAGGARSPDIWVTAQISIGTEAYKGLPGFTTVDGFASLRPNRGHIDILNGNYSMHFANMFDQAWPFDSARGRVNYHRQGSDIKLTSGLVELRTGSLVGFGKVHVNLSTIDKSKNNWGLMIGIHDADLTESHRYLPRNLSSELRSWLDRAIVSGDANKAGLLFHGSLLKEVPKIEKAYELYFKVDNAVLDYDPKWPQVEGLNATVYINNHQVASDNARGKIMASDIEHGIVKIDLPAEGKVDEIVIDAAIKGPFSDGVRLMNETPLADITGNVAERWTGTGSMQATGTLSIPVGDRQGEDAYVDVTVTLPGNDLTMPGFDLTATNLTGDVRYESDLGLVSSRVDGAVFDEPFVGSIATDKVGDSGEIVFSLNGDVTGPSLYKWSGQPLLSRVEGKFDYDAQIHVPFGGSADGPYVEATSSLRGAMVDMPAPMTKVDAESERRFSYRHAFNPDNARINLALDDVVRGAFQVRDGVVTGGRLDFGPQTGSVVAYDKLLVRGQLDRVRYEEWDRFFVGIQQLAQVSLESEIAKSLQDIVVNVNELDAFSISLDETRLLIKRGDGHWLISLENAMLAGDIALPDDDASPLGVALDSLTIVQEEGSAGEDPLADIIPQEVEAIDFSTEQLTIDGEDYGRWSFSYRPTDEGALLDNLQASFRQMDVVSPSSIRWVYKDGVHHSNLQGVVEVENLGKALSAWGYAASVEGNDFRLAPVLTWNGSPAMIDLEKVDGQVPFSGGKGRFVQAETGTGALKLLGIFDFAQLMKTGLDFSNVVQKGHGFSSITGLARFDEGTVEVSEPEPIIISSPGGQFKVGGTMDIATEELDGEVIVTLPVGKNLPWYAAYSAIATGPLVGAGVYLAQRVFQNQINQFSSAKYQVTGSIDEPEITFVNLFNDKVREQSSAEASGE